MAPQRLATIVLCTLLMSAASTVLAQSPGMANRYGVCSGLDDSCYNAWADRTSGDEAPWKILIYYHVGEGVRPHANREFGVAALTEALRQRGYEVESSEDPARMQSGFGIRGFDAIVFFNTGRDALDGLGQMALRVYIEGGGGFVGIHNAFGTNFNWTWYEGLLGGAQLYDHAPLQPAMLVRHSSDDVSTAHLQQRTEWTDEFYNVHPNPLDGDDVRLLLSVDESTMQKGSRGYYGHPGFAPGTHPVSWCHYYDGGRAWLSTLGHSEEIFTDESFLQHIVGGIESAMGKEPFCR